jgi:hypothetical protein
MGKNKDAYDRGRSDAESDRKAGGFGKGTRREQSDRGTEDAEAYDDGYTS